MPDARRRFRGLALSLLFHVLVLAGLVAAGERIWSRTLSQGDPALRPGDAGGGGGNRVRYIILPSIPRPASPPRFEVTLPVPPVELVQTKVPEPVLPTPSPTEPVDTAAVAEVVRSGSETATGSAGQGNDGGAGAGGAPGTGAGAGTGGTGGGGGTLRPPEPRDMALPFDPPPKELRGASLDVTFWVRVDGRVERYTVRPEIKDREYAKKFDKVMREFRFTPARTPDGTRVADTTTISFTLQGKSSS
jgi:hypothetical protein